MSRVSVLALKHLLLGLGFFITLTAFALIAIAFLYLSLGVNKQLLEKYLGEQIQRPVQIESIETGWDGLLLEMKATGIHVRHEDGRQSTLRLRQLEVSVDPLYLLGGRFKVEKTVVYGLSLEVTRRSDGSIHMGDLAVAYQDLSGPNPFGWLRGPGDTKIRESQIIWRDQRDTDRPITVTEFNLETRGDDTQIRFTGRASPPTELGNQIYFNGVIRGSPFRGRTWDGDINISLSRVGVDRLPLAVREFLPRNITGLADVRLKTRWQDGNMTYADADVELSELIVALGSGTEAVPVQKFIGEITWRGYPDSWSLSLKDPQIAVNGRWFRTKQVKIDSARGKHKYFIEEVKIHDALNVVAQIQAELPWQEAIFQSRAYGVLRNVSLLVDGPFLAPNYWSIDSEFTDVSWSSFGAAPGVTGANGSIHLEPGQGRVTVDDDDLRISLPGTLAQPLFFDRVAAQVNWKRKDTDWLINVSNLRLDDSKLRGGRGHVNLHVFSDGRAPHVSGVFSAEKLQVERLWQYLPRGVIPDKTIGWFKQALVKGAFVDLNASMEGDIERFPVHPGEGSFSLTTEVVDGRFHYEDGWPDIEEITGTLSINNVDLRVEVTSAKFNQSTIKQGLVTSPDIFSKAKELNINASSRAPVKDIVWFLTEGPLLKRQSSLEIAASGEGDLDLNIFLPLSDIENGLKVEGRYVVRDTGLAIQNHFVLSDLQGTIDFTDSTVESTDISGRFMGGETSIAIETIEAGRPPVWVARGQGKVDAAQLLPLLGSAVTAGNVNGASSWTGSLTAEPGRVTLEFASDLAGIEITLPPPLAKKADESRQAALVATFDHGQQNLRFNISPLAGWLDYETQAGQLRLNRGIIALGKEEISPPASGIEIIVSQPSFNADRWLALFSTSSEQSAAADTSSASAITGIDAEIGKLHLFARDWSDARIKAASSNGVDWNAWVSGDGFLGKAALRFNVDGQPNRYTLNFTRLHVPKISQQGIKRKESSQPNHYPELNLRADHFRYADWDLGKLELIADPQGSMWQIKKLHLDQPGLKIESRGRWLKNAAGPVTHIRADVYTDDVAVALEKLRLPPHIAESDVHLQLDLNWAGDPAGFSLNDLNGDFAVTATQGRFLNVEPGSGRLLGLFNIDAISRRFSLDFSDIYSKGLAFDQIKGQGRISSGNLYTEGLFVVGPSAAVEIGGRIGLAAEDYDLEVVVVPQLGSHISMLSALANPIAGAMVFIAQKVMKKTFNKLLSEMAHYRYQIQGSWEDPVITSVLLEPVSEEESMR